MQFTEKEDDSGDPFLPYKRRQESLRANEKRSTPVPSTKAATKDTKRIATKGPASLNATAPALPAPGRRTRSATAPKAQQTAPARPVPAPAMVRTRSQAAKAASEQTSAPGPKLDRKRITSSTSTKATFTRASIRTLPTVARRPLATLAKTSQGPHKDKGSGDDDDDDVMPELMVPQTAYLDLLAGDNIVPPA